LVSTAANALLLGVNPMEILNQGREDYLVSIGILQKAIALKTEEKGEEFDVLAKMIAMELSQVLAKIF
jgi:hypothetical protein